MEWTSHLFSKEARRGNDINLDFRFVSLLKKTVSNLHPYATEANIKKFMRNRTETYGCKSFLKAI